MNAKPCTWAITSIPNGTVNIVDVDNDGDLDLFVCSINQEPSYQQVWANDWNGGFGIAPSFTTDDWYYCNQWWLIADIDNDWFVDRVVWWSFGVRYLRNNWLSWFTLVHTFNNNGSFTIWDVNGDDAIDIVTNFGVWINNAWTFAASPDRSLPAWYTAVRLRDTNDNWNWWYE